MVAIPTYSCHFARLHNVPDLRALAFARLVGSLCLSRRPLCTGNDQGVCLAPGAEPHLLVTVQQVGATVAAELTSVLFPMS